MLEILKVTDLRESYWLNLNEIVAYVSACYFEKVKVQNDLEMYLLLTF